MDEAEVREGRQEIVLLGAPEPPLTLATAGSHTSDAKSRPPPKLCLMALGSHHVRKIDIRFAHR